ncbi:MAG: hypothetical protein IK035_01240 [Firmicutes bacterium]|nr:hypothetical protein [Bacillota bacterium]
MSDSALFVIIAILEALAIYNLYDTATTMMMHLGKNGISTRGTIATLKKAMRRDRARLMVPTNGKVDTRDIPCDYLVDLAYEREDGEMVLIKDFVIPSVMKLTAGSGTPIYREGQDLPLKVSRRLKKLAVVDVPEVRRRQVSWIWLFLWVLTVIALGAILVSLIAAL